MPSQLRRSRALALIPCFGLLLGPCAHADDGCREENLLSGKIPTGLEGIAHPERLTDGIAAEEGDDWQVDLVSTVYSNTTLTYDLERPARVRSAYLQGDHRGPYTIEASQDGKTWFELWTTPAAEGAGLRSRAISTLDRVLRYVRVVNPRPGEATGLTEIQLSCTRQDRWPTVVVRAGSIDNSLGELRERYRWQQALHKLNVGLLGSIGFIALLLPTQRVRRSRGVWLCVAGFTTLLLYAVWRAVTQTVEIERWLQLVGVAAAAIALALVTRAMLSVRFRAGDEPITGNGLAAAAAIGSFGAGLYALATAAIYGALHWTVTAIAALAVIAFAVRGRRRGVLQRYLPLACIALGGAVSATNFGTFFQWRDVVAGIGADAELNRTTSWGSILFHDQFHYYLGSKYFPELRYQRLYDCTALAEVENGRGAAIEAGSVRNLRDNMLEPGTYALRRAEQCRRAFSRDRWEAFRRDVDYFRSRVERVAQQRHLTDHGYNATPLWTTIGRVVSAGTSASERSVLLLSMLDVAFLAASVVLIAWAFAPEAAALAVLVWGVGQAWFFVHVGGFGSFDRFDWLFALVAAVCLLKKQFGRAAGVALVASSLLRVFPGAFFLGPGARGVYQLWRDRRLDGALRRFVIGAVAGLAILVPLSILGTDAKSYGEFVRNSQKHAETPLTNYMGLRTLFYWDPATRDRLIEEAHADPLVAWKEQRRITFEKWRPWYAMAAAALIGLTILLSLRSSELWLITLAGVVPMFCLFELTNYFYAVMALFACWAYRDVRHSGVLLGLAISGTVVYLHLEWLAMAYVANSVLVLAVLIYFLVSALFATRAGAQDQ